MSTRGEVLVAIMHNPLDLVIARDQHWYRIPVPSAEKLLKERWPPQWLAFYQTKIFGDEAYAVSYYARVLDIRKVFRWGYSLSNQKMRKGCGAIINRCNCHCSACHNRFSAGAGGA